jgi:hypothetical protein
VNENLSDVRPEGSRHSRNKKREYLKDKINEIASYSKNKNFRKLYRSRNKLREGWQPTTNLVDIRGAIYFRILIKFRTGGRITSVSC